MIIKNNLRYLLLVFIIGVLAVISLVINNYLFFKEPVVPRVENVTKVVVYGDSRSNPEIHQKIVNQIINTKPAAIFHVGDLVDEPENKKEWEGVNAILKPLQASSLFFVAAGNHEKESLDYYNNFNLPGNEKWYSWDVATTHFIVLDTNLETDLNSEQYKWVKQDLELAAKSKFRVIITHHPFLSVGPHVSEKNNFNQDLNNLFIKNKVAIVFSGHEHNYERFLDNNINYIVTGGGGAPLHDQSTDNPKLKQFTKAYNFCLLSIEENKIIVTVFNDDGQIIDSLLLSSL